VFIAAGSMTNGVFPGPGAVTVNLFVRVPNWPSGFVTKTFHCPAAFPVRGRVQVIVAGKINYGFNLKEIT
jgi:hypothetical protein